MNELKQKAEQWWNDRTDQERSLLMLLVPFLFIGCLYWFVWTPIAEGAAQAEQRAAAERAGLASIKENANRYVKLKGNDGAGGADNLSQQISASANRAGLSIARMQPQGEKLQVWLDDAQFETLMSWLSDLQKQRIWVENFEVTRTDASGVVQVRRLLLTK